MKSWIRNLALVAAMGMTSSLWAQLPGAGGAAGGAASAGGAGAAGAGNGGAVGGGAAPATGGGNIWNFFGINKTCLGNLKVRLCKSNIGLMMGNMLKPASVMSGGLLPQCCPRVLQDDTLAKAPKGGPDAPSDAEVAAAKSPRAKRRPRHAAPPFVISGQSIVITGATSPSRL